MRSMQDFLNSLSKLFNMVTDWLLITIGIVLIVKSAVAIDVPLARYVVMGFGGLLVIVGLWYRHHRKKQCR